MKRSYVPYFAATRWSKTGPGTAAAFFTCLLAAGCSSGHTAATTSSTTQASAYLGALSGSAASSFALSSDGTVATTASTSTTTNSLGSFAVPQQPSLIEVKGGSYKEEATGNAEALSGDDALRAAYTTAPSMIVVSPFTEAIVVDAQARGGLNSTNLSDATAKMQAFLNGVDPLTTMPAAVAPGTPVSTPSNGNWMAFALGVESQMRTEYGIDHATAVQAIVGQAENGDTLLTCDGVSGNLALDGTLTAPQGNNCAFTAAAAHFAPNPLNTSGITALPTFTPTLASPSQYATVTPDSCGDRVSLLRDNLSLFDGRKDDVQANLQGLITLENWMTVATGKWGPSKSTYGAITAPATCTDVDTFRRELVMAVENYWIDHGLNYCHHHIPGWLPPDDSSKKKPYYRNAPAKPDTSGGGGNDLTCTAQRSATGEQKTSVNDAFDPTAIQWHGLDCSNFTAWSYDFAGVATEQLPGKISQQSCSVDGEVPGVLLDINSANFAALAANLKPGDLLYITQKSALTGKDSYLNGTGENASTYAAAHVVTWTGKRWSDLQAGADRDKYDLSKLGAAGSRLGGDLNDKPTGSENSKYLGYNASLLGTDAAHDPWMIIDSHFAGPAYRPFVPADATNHISANWYGSSLSAVRRIIGASEVTQDGSPLKAYVMGRLPGDTSDIEVIASPQAQAHIKSGRRLIQVMGGPMAGCQLAIPK